MEFSKHFEDAMALLKQEPLPDNAADQLQALEKKIPKSELKMFGSLWSAYYAAGGKLVPADDEDEYQDGLQSPPRKNKQ